MNSIALTWDDKDLQYGLDSLKTSVNEVLGGAGCRLDEDAKKAWRRAIASDSVLSKARNGNEWFSFNKRTWYITNKWKTPDPVWAGKEFLQAKRRQADNMLGRHIGQKKQEELDKAIEFAISKF
jgi:hypothetical protein